MVRSIAGEIGCINLMVHKKFERWSRKLRIPKDNDLIHMDRRDFLEHFSPLSNDEALICF